MFRVFQYRDTHAYGELYDAFYGSIRRYLFFKLPTAQDADELTSEVFLRGWEFSTSTRVEHAGALFFQIARRLISDFYRANKEMVPLGGLQLEAERETFEEKSEVWQIAKSLHKIKDEYRELIILHYLNDMSVKEIATIFDKTPNNIRVSLHRARKALKRVVDSQ